MFGRNNNQNNQPIINLLAEILQTIKGFSSGVLQEIKKMASGIDALTQAVADLTTVVKTNTDDVTAATGAISNLTSQLAAAAGDPAKLADLATQIEAQVTNINNSNTALAAAVPAPPAPTV